MPRVACPGCGKVGEVPDAAMSAKIRCPACDRRFCPNDRPETVEYPRAALEPWVPPPSVPARIDPEVIRAVRLPDLPPPPALPTRRLCPFCAEPIMTEAKVCKHCREVLDPVMRAADEAKRHEAMARPAPPPSAPTTIVRQSVVVHRGRHYRVPHVLHFFLTLATLGLWLPIWILHWLINSAQED
jgi:hypothetical protein